MKKTVLTAGLMLLFTMSYSQTKQPVLIGVDLLKPILSLATPNQPAYRLAEATIRIPLNANYLSISAGYSCLHSDIIYRNILLNTQGYYLKIGQEAHPPSRKGLVLGWNGLISTCRETGTYSFSGPTFGDYVAPIPERRRVAIGFEGTLGYQFPLSQRLLLHLSGRVTAAALLGSKMGEVRAYFVPGIGHTFSDPLVYSVGLGLHLLYQIQPRSSATSSNDQNH